MTDIIHSIIIGVVQGITEFLPISSSAHLKIIPELFNWQYKGLAFDVALHFGTVIAIVAYFWKDWLEIIARGFGVKKAKFASGDSVNSYPDNTLWQIVAATIPAGIVGVLINDFAEEKLGYLPLIAINLALFGFLLWWVDKRQSHTARSVKTISFKDSLIVGAAQSLALVPGISRSGITLIASRSRGFNREEAARFSFLLGTPAMLGAFILKIRDIEHSELNAAFWIAVVSSTVFGFLTIKYLLQYLRKSDFAVFLWYRVILAIIVLIMFIAR